MNQPGLIIAIPTIGRPTSVAWAMSLKSLNPPINFATQFSVIEGKPVDVARNEAAAHAIAVNAKYLYFIGDDTINPSHALKQFIFRMENDPMVGIVGGIYVSKSEPPAPLVFRGNGQGSYWDWKAGEYFECTGLGMDATFIRVECLSELKKAQPNQPLFKTVDEDRFLDGLNSCEQWTEDLYFLDRVKKHTNFKIMCDASVLCDHVDAITNKVYSIPRGSLPFRQFSTQGKKKVIDLGCGPLYREFEEGPTLRVDLNEAFKPDYRCDVSNLPFENDEFDLVFSSHVLEHFAKGRTHDVLDEWIRILKPGGELRLVLPNIMWAVEQLSKNPKQYANAHVMNVLYGGQSDALDYHYNGFTTESITETLELHQITVESIKQDGFNMTIRGFKQPPMPQPVVDIQDKLSKVLNQLKSETKLRKVIRKSKKIPGRKKK